MAISMCCVFTVCFVPPILPPTASSPPPASITTRAPVFFQSHQPLRIGKVGPIRSHFGSRVGASQGSRYVEGQRESSRWRCGDSRSPAGMDRRGLRHRREHVHSTDRCMQRKGGEGSSESHRRTTCRRTMLHATDMLELATLHTSRYRAWTETHTGVEAGILPESRFAYSADRDTFILWDVG